MVYSSKARSINGKKAASDCRAKHQLSGQPVIATYMVLVNYSNKTIRKYFTQAGDQCCPMCGDLFVPNNFVQVYCNRNRDIFVRSSCSSKSNDMKRYFREHQNPDKYKDRRESNRLRAKAVREKYKRDGLCSRCGKQEPSPGYLVCGFCRKDIELHRNR